VAQTWQLLSRLPIAPHVYHKIVTLEDVRSTLPKPQWKALLDPACAYKLIYALHIIQFLLEEDG
jgi:hypothetical protein